MNIFQYIPEHDNCSVDLWCAQKKKNIEYNSDGWHVRSASNSLELTSHNIPLDSINMKNVA